LGDNTNACSSTAFVNNAVTNPSLVLPNGTTATTQAPTDSTTKVATDAFVQNLEPFVSIKTFGAVGDGTTDDTTSIQNTITSVQASGGTVFFPAGTYKITSSLTSTGRVTFLGVGYNATPNLRFNLDGRYFGTTNPTVAGTTWNNNNFSLIASVQVKFGSAPPPPPPPPPAVAPPSFMVFFDWDRSNLSQQALATIKQAADAFKQKGNARITATGHTDTSGPEAYNMALSLRRANAVKDALVREGVPAQAITVIGRGEQGLLVQTGDGVREPQNRRVEVAIPQQMAAAPPTNDQAYCAQLARLWRNYDRTTAQGPGPQAIAKCDAGDYAGGIPVLEKLLTDARIQLPPRT